MSTEIALSRRQKVFAVAEVTPGTLVFPTAADFIRPAGDAVMNQTPAFMDSKEKADTLDVLDQFTNALPPGDWSCPMYLRLKDLSTKPQGAVLLESLLGGYTAGGVIDGTLTANIDGAVTTLGYSNLADGVLPPAGVITIGTEKIRYSGVTVLTATTGTLTNCVRGYGGTTAVSHTLGDALVLASPFFYPTTSAPAFSIWIQTDHFVQFLTGATTNNTTVSVKNEDGVTFNLKGQGMRMGWAGTDELVGAETAGSTVITVQDSNKYTVGARIYNKTKADYATAGYEITAINGSDLTITPGIAKVGGWSDGDVIAGYLPDPGALTTAVIENRKSAVKINNVTGKLRTTDITIDTPKTYLSDEVGTQYVSEYVEDMRKISATVNSYFKKDDVGKFKTAAEGTGVPLEVIYGDTMGKTLSVYMPKMKLSVPTINFESPTVSLQTTATALGTQGEDSIYMIVI